VRLVAYRARAGCESAPARTTTIKLDRFELLSARSFGPTFVLLQDGQRSGDLTAECWRAVSGDAGGMTGAGHADVIKDGIGDVTDLQGGAAGGATRWVTNSQERGGHGFAKVRGEKVLWGNGLVGWVRKHRGYTRGAEVFIQYLALGKLFDLWNGLELVSQKGNPG
jgi:hypothetical protein